VEEEKTGKKFVGIFTHTPAITYAAAPATARCSQLRNACNSRLIGIVSYGQYWVEDECPGVLGGKSDDYPC